MREKRITKIFSGTGKLWLLTTFGLIVFLLIILIPEQSYAAIKISPLHKVLVDDANIKKVWTQVRNAVNYLVIAVLIFIAFANILRINLNNYAIKKFLPTLIFAAIASNFSYLICRMLVDASNVVMDLLMSGVKGENLSGVAGAFDFTTDAYPVDPNNLNRSFVFILGEFVGAIAILILAFLFFIRNYVIYFLVGLAPLAFMSTIIPQAKNLFNQWWKMYLQWVFLPIISLFWLWIGGMWYSSGITGNSSISAERTTDFNSAVLALAFGLVCYYLAITTPLKAGGAVMGAWSNAGKKVWGKTGGAAWNSTGGAAIKAGQKWVNDKYSNVKRDVKDYARDNVWGVKQISDRIEKGRMSQQLKEAVFEKRDFKRQRRALADIMEDGRYKRNPEMVSRVKAMQAKYFVGDEYDREKHAGMKNQALLDASTFIEDENGDLRFASNEEIIRGGLIIRDQNGNEIGFQTKRFLRSDGVTERTFKDREDRLDKAAENAAADKELQLRRKGSRNQADTPGGETPSEILERLKGNLDTRTMASSAVPLDTVDAFEEAAQDSMGGQAGSSTRKAGGNSANYTQAAQQASYTLDVEEHKKVAYALTNQSGTGSLRFNTNDISVIANSASMNIPPEGTAKIAEIASQSMLSVAEQIREKTRTENDEANREARVAGSVMNQLSSAPNAKNRQNELIDLTEEGRKHLSGGTRESLGDAMAAAELINPESSVLLRELSQRGDTDRLKERLMTIFDTTESELSKYQSELALQQELAAFKGDKREWQKQYVHDRMEGIPQQAHREVVLEQIPDKIMELPDNAGNDRVEKLLAAISDNIIASNSELTEALSKLSSEDRASVLDSARNDIKTVINSQIIQAQSGQQLSPADLKNAYVAAFTDPKVVKQQAKQTGDALNNSLRKTNDLLTKKSSSGQQIHDVAPPRSNYN